MSWEQVFFDPIELPDGGALRSLRDAGEFIQSASEGDAGSAGMAGSSQGVDAGRRVQRRSNVGSHRGHAGVARRQADGAAAAPQARQALLGSLTKL